MHYRNKKGNIVHLSVTLHALDRFIERYRKLFPDEVVTDWSTKLELVFKCSNQCEKENSNIKKRRKYYGKDTIYFHSQYFRFVVQDCELVTCEIRHAEHRHLN
jgi:hypothetical protein